ncbi:MAG: hypothetical protein EBE86_015740 [Hormoscilla sp. GUM202]|nr:hypothetical protein [Hormoscilla sp. GUM202]
MSATIEFKPDSKFLSKSDVDFINAINKSGCKLHDLQIPLQNCWVKGFGTGNSVNATFLKCVQHQYERLVKDKKCVEQGSPEAISFKKGFISAVYQVMTQGNDPSKWLNVDQMNNLLDQMVDYDEKGDPRKPFFSKDEKVSKELKTKCLKRSYEEIKMTVDTEGILAQSGTNVGEYITLTDNHPETSTYQNNSKDELDVELLEPDETIHWIGVSENKRDTIQLTEFHPWVPELLTDLITKPIIVGNECFCKVLDNPKVGVRYAYNFYFKINGGTTIYWFDPFLGNKED